MNEPVAPIRDPRDQSPTQWTTASKVKAIILVMMGLTMAGLTWKLGSVVYSIAYPEIPIGISSEVGNGG